MLYQIKHKNNSHLHRGKPSASLALKLNMNTSPLYRFDVQIWENLIVYIDSFSLLQLLNTGDERIMRDYVRTIRRLEFVTVPFYSALQLDRCSTAPPVKNINGYYDMTSDRDPSKKPKKQNHSQTTLSRLLECTMSANLQCLRLDSFSADISSSTDMTLLCKLPTSQLLILQLKYWAVGHPLHLPDTLTCLQIDTLWWNRDIDNFVAGGPKICSLALRKVSCAQSLDTDVVLDATFKNLVQPFARTLKYLNWALHDNYALDLHNHTALSHLAVTPICLENLVQFGVPPSLKSILPLYGSSFGPAPGVQTLAHFTRLKLLNLSQLKLTLYPQLDISQSPSIKLLTLSNHLSFVKCAPTKKLQIVTPRCPKQINNDGPGIVIISCDVYCVEDQLDLLLIPMLDWQSLDTLILNFDQTVLSASLDYEPFKLAKNISRLNLFRDNVDRFGTRDGVSFLTHFPKLSALSWSLDANLFISLEALGFLLPDNIQSLTMRLTSRPTVCSNMGWLQHTPRNVTFEGIPLVPRIVDMCNNATTPFNLHLECSIEQVNWRDIPIFQPSTSVQSAKFRFSDIARTSPDIFCKFPATSQNRLGSTYYVITYDTI